MPQISIDIPTGQVDRVQAGLGVTTVAEAKEWIINSIKDRVKAHEAKDVKTAEDAKIAQAETDKEAAVNAVGADVDASVTIS